MRFIEVRRAQKQSFSVMRTKITQETGLGWDLKPTERTKPKKHAVLSLNSLESLELEALKIPRRKELLTSTTLPNKVLLKKRSKRSPSESRESSSQERSRSLGVKERSRSTRKRSRSPEKSRRDSLKTLCYQQSRQTNVPKQFEQKPEDSEIGLLDSSPKRFVRKKRKKTHQKESSEIWPQPLKVDSTKRLPPKSSCSRKRVDIKPKKEEGKEMGEVESTSSSPSESTTDSSSSESSCSEDSDSQIKYKERRLKTLFQIEQSLKERKRKLPRANKNNRKRNWKRYEQASWREQMWSYSSPRMPRARNRAVPHDKKRIQRGINRHLQSKSKLRPSWNASGDDEKLSEHSTPGLDRRKVIKRKPSTGVATKTKDTPQKCRLVAIKTKDTPQTKDTQQKCRLKGIIKFFDPYRGWGMITTEGKKDIFVHKNNINWLSHVRGFRGLREGSEVEYEPGKEDNKMKAFNVTSRRGKGLCGYVLPYIMCQGNQKPKKFNFVGYRYERLQSKIEHGAVCDFWLRGTCVRGSQCIFRHETKEETAELKYQVEQKQISCSMLEEELCELDYGF